MVLGLLTISSCDNRDKEKRVFDALYQNKFYVNDSLTIEYVDSSFFVFLTGKDSVDGYNLGKWSVESELFGTVVKSQTVLDSPRLKVTDISADMVKLKFKGKTIDLKKNKTIVNFDIKGKWKCVNCSPLPPYRNGESDEMRTVTYEFRNDNTFEIEEEFWRAKGVWKLSKSGQLTILNKISKTGDFIEGDLLILNSLVDDTLNLSIEDDIGHLTTRNLVRAQN
jgi:hypothetical protein